jgi:Cu(I)/Ag(I) efflux system membrane fusion protein
MDERVVSLDKIAQALAGVGHDAGKHKAPDEVYDGLPGCCGYRE